MEIEKEKQLPFLDVLIEKKEDGRLGHTVYRKPTHTDRYLNALSHHHPAQLKSVVKTLVTRFQRLADKENYNQEMERIQQSLQKNGFSKKTIDTALKPTKLKQKVDEQPIATACVPYIKGTTEKIGKILRKHNIRTAYTTDNKISKILRSAKDKIPLESQGVYEIPCRDCNKSYIGQTNRRISVRKEEHINAVRKGEKTSSLAQHVTITGHTIDFGSTKTLASINKTKTRITREAIEIEKHPNNLNSRDDTQRLPPAWKPALKRIDVKETELVNNRPMTRGRTRNQSSAPNRNDHTVYKEGNDTKTNSSLRITRSRAKAI